MEKPSPPYEYPASEGLQLDERRMPPITQLQPDHADDKAPLVFYSIEGKEVVPKNGQTGKRYCGLTPAVFWIILIVVILLVVGGAVGAGVGISLAGKSKHSLLSNSITPSPSPLSTLENDISSPSEITSESTSTSSTSSPSPTCPTTLRLCAFDATCSGRNNPLNQVGTCADGCTCKSTCGAINGLCTTYGGKNDPLNSGMGTCETGTAKGCFCDSVCGTTNGSCNSNGCLGKGGFCTSGQYWGCGCVDDKEDD